MCIKMDLRRNSGKPARADVNVEEMLDANRARHVVATKTFCHRDLLKRELPMFIELKGPIPELLLNLSLPLNSFLI